MAYEQKDGQGSLFKNDKQGNENWADYRGSITIEGRQYWLSAWIKAPKNGGDKYMSLSAKPKDEQRDARHDAQKRAAAGDVDPNDDIPF